MMFVNNGRLFINPRIILFMKFIGWCFIALGIVLAVLSTVFNAFQLFAIAVTLALIGIVTILATEHADEDHRKFMETKNGSPKG